MFRISPKQKFQNGFLKFTKIVHKRMEKAFLAIYKLFTIKKAAQKLLGMLKRSQSRKNYQALNS